MKFAPFWTKQAMKDLSCLEERLADRIISKVDFYCEQKDPFQFASRLRRELKGLYRFRIGDYRVVFRKDKKGGLVVLLVLRVMDRKDVYA